MKKAAGTSAAAPTWRWLSELRLCSSPPAEKMRVLETAAAANKGQQQPSTNTIQLAVAGGIALEKWKRLPFIPYVSVDSNSTGCMRPAPLVKQT
mmetsp:Transcript_33164/g.65348  ORF Transcript_33164/g.65348 Transcript_33164/m.65348 type:complete len:94 (-) Transcript_33164:661-942(-)